jgi:co-chaperonin GroES (HSP10)
MKCLRIQVLAIGPGNLHVEAGNTRRIRVTELLGAEIKVGDVVVTNRYTNVMKVDGRDVRVFGPGDIIGIESE